MKRDSCIHYTGCLNPRSPTCKAGVNYREHAGGDGFGWVKRLPCFKLENGDPAAVVKCDLYQEPTAEQIAAHEAEVQAAIAKLMTAYTGKVREWREANKWDRKNPKAATGKVPCEACGKGEIHLTMAAYNGHVWGKCTTEGCISWME